MIIGQVQYKMYNWSKKATALSVVSAIFKAVALMGFFGLIVLFINPPLANNQNTVRNGITFCLSLGIISIILGILIGKLSDNIANKTFVEKISSDLKFARAMGRKMPELKQNFMELNPEYAEYINSGKDEIEPFESGEKKRPLTQKQYLIILSVLSILCLIIAFLAEHNYI